MGRQSSKVTEETTTILKRKRSKSIYYNTMFRLTLVLFAAMRISDACLEYGFTYGKSNKLVVGKVETSSADECQRACQDEELCEYWGWRIRDHDKPTNTCYLKSSKGKKNKPEFGNIVGPKFCECFAYDASIGRNAGELMRVEEVFGPLDCMWHCQDTPGCENWIWNGPEKTGKPNSCQLKLGLGEGDNSFGELRDIGRISGPRDCNGSFPTCPIPSEEFQARVGTQPGERSPGCNNRCCVNQNCQLCYTGPFGSLWESSVLDKKTQD